MIFRRNRAEAVPNAPDPINQNIDAVVALHNFAEQQVDPHQRKVETLTAWLGRPQFFYGILVGVSTWMLINGLAAHFGRHWDDPPFAWLQGAAGLGGLLMTTVVLITQNRQGKLAERREQLDLQMSMLTEQRTAKIIDLLEELRRDMPSVRNRVDLEAEALTKTVDPHEVLATLESKMEEALEAAGTTDEASRLVVEQLDVAAVDTQEEILRSKQEGEVMPPGSEGS